MRRFRSVTLASLLVLAPAASGDGPVSVLGRRGSGFSCRADAGVVAGARGPATVRVLRRKGPRVPASAGLHIVLRGTANLDTHPEAREAIFRAADRWESVIRSAVTVVLDIDYGPNAFGAPWPEGVAGLTRPQFARRAWGTVRGALAAGADTPAQQALAAALPPGPIPTDAGPVSWIRTPTGVFRALGILPAVENPATETEFGDPASVALREGDFWDFDPRDGIDRYTADFDAVVMHEMGHALGFMSAFGSESSFEPAVTLLDLYRFRAGTTPDLATGQRLIRTRGDHVFFAGGDLLPLAPRDSDGSDPSHWRTEWLAGTPIGVMDPGGYWTGRVTLTGRDLAALAAMGWKVTAAPVEESVRTVPVVLDAAGVGGVRFSTELTLSSKSRSTADVEMTYTAATALGASGSGTAHLTLAPHTDALIPDVVGWLRERGLAIPASGSQGGTLRITFRADDSPNFFAASARTSSPSGRGRAGLAYPALLKENAPRGTSYVFGLRETTSDRSNLAFANLGDAPITLRVTLHDGESDAATRLDDVTLEPGQWAQRSRVLAPLGYAHGWASVGLASGDGPYAAYGVFNDNATNDGSYVAAVPAPIPPNGMLVPVVVETAAFSSELVVANPLDVAVSVTLIYNESLNRAAGPGGRTSLALGPRRQVVLPNAVDWLRGRGLEIGPRGAGSYAGEVAVLFQNAASDYVGGLAGARTSSPGDGGAYGLFTPGAGSNEWNWGFSWVLGLRQDESVRSNLAISNVSNWPGDVRLHVQAWDTETGALVGRTESFTLGLGEWKQFDGFLAAFGLKRGAARVVYESGDSSIVAYGVLNDGATPASGATNDGSYVAASNY